MVMMNEPHDTSESCKVCEESRDRIISIMDRINGQKQSGDCDIEFLVATYNAFVTSFNDLSDSGNLPKFMVVAVYPLLSVSRLLEACISERNHGQEAKSS